MQATTKIADGKTLVWRWNLEPRFIAIYDTGLPGLRQQNWRLNIYIQSDGYSVSHLSCITEDATAAAAAAAATA